MNPTEKTKPESESESEPNRSPHSADYAPYPKLDPVDLSVHDEEWSTVSMSTQSEPENPVRDVPVHNEKRSTLSMAAQSEPGNPVRDVPVQVEGPSSGPDSATTMPPESNPYVSSSPAPPSSMKNTVDSVKVVLGKWGKKAQEATKRAEDLAGNMWQHLKTAPSFADAAVGRISQGTKVLAEGGYEKIFQQTFENAPEEQLLKSYACYLSTSAGPVMGVLYMSTAKLAFSSDDPLSYQVGDKTEWSYYKVVIPLHQLKAVNPSTSKVNAAEKYIQIISVDNHEFWFLGFVNYENAVKNLQGALQPRNL